MRRQSIAIGSLVLAAAAFTYINVQAEDQPKPLPENLQSVNDRMSYIVGNNIGRELKQNQFDVNIETFTRGMRDALEGKESQLTEEQVRDTLMTFQQQMLERQRAEGKKFLEANAKKEGVKVLPSGLQYKVIKSGEAGAASPGPNDTFVAHYRGTLIDGTEFDNSYTRGQPLSLPVQAVVRGWVEALQLMKVGDKWELYIPSELAYGEAGRGPIPPHAVLIFEMELLDVKKEQ